MRGLNPRQTLTVALLAAVTAAAAAAGSLTPVAAACASAVAYSQSVLVDGVVG